MYDEVDSMMHGDSGVIAGLVRVGRIDPVGAEAAQAAFDAGDPGRGAEILNAAMMGKPSPPFGRSARETSRRAPLGFSELGTGARFFTLLAGVGQTTTMHAKVQRTAHVDRLLIVPDAPGAVIQSIMIGDDEQVLSPGAPVELYSEFALTDTLPDNFSPLQTALDFIVTLQNTTAGPITGTIGCKARVER